MADVEPGTKWRQSLGWLSRTFWKWRLRVHYLRYLDASDHLDCGAMMAEVMNPWERRHRLRVNACLGRLRALGGDVPTNLPDPGA